MNLFSIMVVVAIFFPIFLIKSVEVTLANNIIQVSGVCFWDTSPTYYTVCLPPKVKSSYIIYLTLFTLHLPPSTSFLLAITVPFFCVWEFLFFLLLCYCQFSIPHMNEITWFLTFSVWLISLSLVFSRPIHIVKNGHNSSFHLTSLCISFWAYEFSLIQDSLYLLVVCWQPLEFHGLYMHHPVSASISHCNRVQPRGRPQIGICMGSRLKVSRKY